jgi:4-hydroxybutyrate CoA-transferase
MPEILAPERVPDLLRPGMIVFVEGASGEPSVLLQALADAPEASAGVHYVGCLVPGVNRVDPASFHAEASLTSFFVSGDLARSYQQGKVRFLPLHYSAIYSYLAALPVDLALIQVTPPDARGLCSLGPSVHFVPAVLDRARMVIAEVNAAMPRPAHSHQVPYERLDFVVETSRPLLQLPGGAPSEQAEKIAVHVAGLIEDGDTLQVGIGKVPASILAALHGHQRLAFHGGMVTDEVIDLQAAGALGRMVCCTALGTRIYAWTAGRNDLRFMPVSHTHDMRVLAQTEHLVAINAVLAVDLFGQANAEMLDGRQVSGTGGLLDFVRGARLSPGGRSILALPSTTGKGTSRIVARLGERDVVSVPRADADIVVTEHGVAQLREKSLDERAQALIGIADPSARDSLEDGWRRMRVARRR